MYLATCLFLLLILVHTESSKPRSVNLALETVLEFGNKDNSGDVQILDKVQRFLDKVKTVIENNKTARRNLVPKNDITFADFVKKVINVLIDYDNDDLEDTFAVFDDELRKYHYKGCKFYELMEDHSVRRFMADQLESLKNRPAKSIRRSLKYIMKEIDNKYNDKVADLLHYLNSFYTTKSSKGKLSSFLNNLESYKSKSKRANLDLLNMIRTGIRSIIFDHFSGLKLNVRRDIKIRLQMFWKPSRKPSKVEQDAWDVNHTEMDMETTNNIQNLDDNSLTEKYTNTEEYEKYQFDKHHHTVKKYIDLNQYDHTIAKYINKHGDKFKKKHKNRSKTTSSFMTLYPQEITYERKKSRFKIDRTTKRYKLQTLRPEEQYKKRSFSHVRNDKLLTKLVFEHDAKIVVQDEDKVQAKHDEVPRRYRSRTKEVKNKRYEYKVTRKHKKRPNIPKSTPDSHETTAAARKSSKSIHSPTSYEGMDIETFENDRMSLRKSNKNDSMKVTRGNVYQDIMVHFNKLADKMKAVNKHEKTNVTERDNTATDKTTVTSATSKSINITDSIQTAITTSAKLNTLKVENVTKPISTQYNFNFTTKAPEVRAGIALRSLNLNPHSVNNTKPLNETKNGTLEYYENRINVTTERYMNMTTTWKVLNVTYKQNKKVSLGKELKKHNTTETTTPVFDLNNFINDSVVLQLQDETKKKALFDITRDLKKMFQGNNLSVAPTKSDLEFTDPFQNIEAAINLL